MARKKQRTSKPAKKSRPPKNSTSASKSDGFQEIIKTLVGRLKTNPGDIQTSLELAEMYNATGLESEIPGLLLSQKSQYPFSDSLLNGRFDRLLAFGYAHQKKLAEAEKTLASATESFPNALDLWYTLSYVKLSLKDNKSAVEAGRRYLDLWEGASAKPHPIGMTCHTSRHKSQLLNFVGSAYKGESDPDEARSYFEQAIKADPGNQFSYLNLANLLISTGMKSEARKIIKSGIDKCSQVHELKMITQALKRDFTISACLMVKDEEEMLPGCLESIRNWVDEIVLVDTGSSDKTIEIAKSYGAKIFHQPWEEDFSKHRNYTIEKATGDWIFIIDADEKMVADDIPLLLRVMSEPVCQIVSMNVINIYGERKNRSVFLPSVRLFKRELGAYYEGIVHNQIKTPEGVPVVRANVRLEHYGYDLTPEKMKEKSERSKALLLKQLDKNPDHAFAHFNLAQLIRTGPDETVKSRSEEVIIHASKAVELTNPDIAGERYIHLMAIDQLAWSHFYLKQHDLALKFCNQALDHKPDYLDPLILLGHIKLEQGKLDEAENKFQDYLSVQAKYDMTSEKDNLIISHIDGRVVAWYALGCISMLKGDSQAATDWFEKVISLDELYLESNAMLGQLYLRQNELEQAERFLLKQINDCDKSSDAHLWLGDLYLRQEKTEPAEKSYRQALSSASNSKRGTDRLIRLYTDSNQTEKLAGIIEEFGADLFNDVARAITLAERLAVLDKHAQAVYIYEGLIHNGLVTGAIQNDLGNCYYRLGDHEKAVECYRRAADKTDSPAVCRRNLAVALVDMKRYSEALEELEKDLLVRPEAVDEYQLAGEISAQLEDYVGAIGYYEKYLSRVAATAGILHRISECYLAMGHRDAAILGFGRAVALEPGFKPSMERLKQLNQPVGQA